VAGLLAHAGAACALTTPTINGYKRYRPFTLAPDRLVWGRDNKGAMLRVVGGPGDEATRVENRVGEPGANPYLYLAAQIVSGLAGIAAGLEPSAPADAPYDTDAPALPRSLIDALAAFRGSEAFRAALGPTFHDYYCRLKEAEIARFLSEVTDWEQREYLSLL
jgi:glutamine synthetase